VVDVWTVRREFFGLFLFENIGEFGIFGRDRGRCFRRDNSVDLNFGGFPKRGIKGGRNLGDVDDMVEKDLVALGVDVSGREDFGKASLGGRRWRRRRKRRQRRRRRRRNRRRGRDRRKRRWFGLGESRSCGTRGCPNRNRQGRG
jgi:hypothetical protein